MPSYPSSHVVQVPAAATVRQLSGLTGMQNNNQFIPIYLCQSTFEKKATQKH